MRHNFGPSKSTVVERYFGPSKSTVLEGNFGPYIITVGDRNFGPSKITTGDKNVGPSKTKVANRNFGPSHKHFYYSRTLADEALYYSTIYSTIVQRNFGRPNYVSWTKEPI